MSDPTATRPRLGDGRFEPLLPLHTRDVSGVFLARDHERGDLCAVKLLDGAEVPDQARQRFLAEARVLQRLRHPHVVRGRGHGDDEGLLWYAMDHLPGGSLHELAGRTRVPPEHALALTFQVLLGLDAVHALGLIHRDVKLTNVLLDDRQRACLMDLGIAHHPEGTVEFQTMAGQDLGTPGYRAPEQVFDPGAADARADVFSTGVVLYRLLTRRPPNRLHVAQVRPALLDEVAAPIRPILLVSTHPEAADRYPTARAMAEAIAHAHDAVAATDEARAWMAQFDAVGEPDPWDECRAWLDVLMADEQTAEG